MKKTLALLTASTALGLAIGLPAWSAMQDDRTGDTVFSAEFKPERSPMRLWFVDDDDDDHGKYARKYRGEHDDDDDDYDDDDDDDDDDDYGRRGDQMNPAP
ncbi:hypothetical protein M4578_13815, partial [Salipiger sp. P9]|uniref:hypothetical protein n=1 Tax=Salipiger pentaromativorans TaxID=2943193 RepID=UPI0021570648